MLDFNNLTNTLNTLVPKKRVFGFHDYYFIKVSQFFLPVNFLASPRIRLMLIILNNLEKIAVLQR